MSDRTLSPSAVPQTVGASAKWLARAAVALGVIVAVVGGGHVVGWVSGYLGPLATTAYIMKTNLALCLLLSGAALVLRVRWPEAAIGRWAAAVCAVVVLALGALALAENAFGWDFGIDQMIAQEPPGALGVVNPNRMGTPASTGLVLAGLSLLAMGRRGNRGARTAQGLALGVCLVALLGTIGVLYGAQGLHAIVRLTAIAWSSAVVLLALGLGLLLARPAEGLMAQATADDPGGANLRRWLPVLLLPVVLGWLRLVGERNWWFDPASGTAIMMILFIIALTVVAYTGARSVSRSSAELQRQREWLQVTLSSIGDAVIATDTAGRVTFLNPVAAGLTGWAEPDALGCPVQQVFRIVNEQTRHPGDDIVARVLRDGGIVALANHTALQARDGREIPIEDSAAPIKDAGGQTTGVVLVFHDVTEKRRASEALRANEEKYRNLFENMTEEVHFWQLVRDEAGRIQTWKLVDANPPTLKTWGRKSMEEVRGRTTDEIFGPGAAEHYMPVVAKVMAEGVPHVYEDYFPNLDKHFRFTTVPLGDCFITTGADITVIKKAQLETATASEFLKIINESTSTRALVQAAVTFFHQQSGCEAVGVRLKEGDDFPYYEARGFPEEFLKLENSLCQRDAEGNIERDIGGKPCIACMCGNVICGRFDPSRPFFSPNGSFWSNGTTELLASTTDGERQARTRNRCNGQGYESVALLPLRMGDNRLGLLQLNDKRTGMFSAQAIALWERLASYLAVALAKLQAEEEMRRKAEELARSNKELEQFAYIASHDLQEPLRQVRAFVQLLKERHADKLDGKSDEYLGYVYEGAARMSELVRGLLDYSRVGAPEERLQPTASQQALDVALGNLRAGIDESQARITHEELPTVMAEPAQLAQLFQNLIGNAIKYRRDGVPPEVHVGCRRAGNDWEFSVRDNGIGIDSAHQEKVFLIFQRLHTQDKYPGTGIGLAICKKIVERHGGRIWVESQVGEGSKFLFTIPAREPVRVA